MAFAENKAISAGMVGRTRVHIQEAPIKYGKNIGAGKD
jgi:hypothetical protein